MIRIEHDVATGEVHEIELTKSEVTEINAGIKARLEADAAAASTLAEQAAIVTQAREALLSKLGITEDEARLLLA